ncbi:MAG TPA: PD-(D/E)XK nuclease family protein [Hyphomonadaceae bacterium]|nr:PD-(D/E)XK nuclease family protein [Hyphomonadaceae bacterium]
MARAPRTTKSPADLSAPNAGGSPATPPTEAVALKPTLLSDVPSDAIATQGWHRMEDETYHADPCLSPSLSSHGAMLVIGKSLLHAWRAHPRSPFGEDYVASSAADRGSAVHSVLFGGKPVELVDAEDYRTSAARTVRDAIRAKGGIPILAKEMAALNAMAEPARERLYALHGGTFLCEETALWKGETAGWRRARIDTISPNRALIVDYKTTEGAVDAYACERRIADMGLQIQAAAYVDAVETLHPELQGRVKFMFQWQEQKPPHALSPPIEMSEAFLSLGRAQWRAAGKLWDQAIRYSCFPGHSTKPFLASPPGWELARWEERALAEQLISGGEQ